MTIHPLRGQPPTALAQALAEFEGQFTYPLGPGRTFHISHGDDYPRFFRAIGQATCFIAEEQGQVLGVIGVAARKLITPEGKECLVAYIGDLKVSPAARGSRVFLNLVRAADAWVRPQVTAAFGVVMDGTRATPESYTGRVGIPGFREVGKVLVWRLPCSTPADAMDEDHVSTRDSVMACYARLSHGRFSTPGGSPEERSEMSPVWLKHPAGQACGLVEDTRRAKRLLADDGSELRSGHLSFFAFQTPAAGAELLRVAMRQAGRSGHPSLFVSVAPPDAVELEHALGAIDKVIAPATIYAAQLEGGDSWNINTSEI